MISLVCPTRQRPDGLLRLYRSAVETAAAPAHLEVVAVIDRDDESYADLERPGLSYLPVDRGVLSNYWNLGAEMAQGPIYGMVADDVVFRTQGWDDEVRLAFGQIPDRIAYVFGDDGTPYWTNHDWGTHGFVHKAWVDATGCLTTPDFSKDYADSWLNDIARAIARSVYIPILIEHLHFSLTGQMDENTRERLERGQHDDVVALYASPGQVAKRQAAAEKLRAVMR